MSVLTTLAQDAIYVASYLYFPALLLVGWFLWRPGRRSAKILAGVFLAGITILAYARFVEPRLLLTRDHDINLCTTGKAGTLRLAVFSDSHHGMFGNAMPMERIVRRIGREGADAVLVPGDFTYYPDKDEIEAIVAPLALLEMPVYAVMGNHDEGIPGPDLTDPLSQTLSALGVEVLDGRDAVLMHQGRIIRIAGMVDHWAALRDGRAHLGDAERPAADLLIYLQHNPDVLREAAGLGAFDLMVAGHTHGGQINLPFITCAMTLACKTLRYGYAQLPEGSVFVTSGTGMVGLPMRFNVPPVIDMLNVTYGACFEEEGG